MLACGTSTPFSEQLRSGSRDFRALFPVRQLLPTLNDVTSLLQMTSLLEMTSQPAELLATERRFAGKLLRMKLD